MDMHKMIFAAFLLLATSLPLSAGGISADDRLRLYFDIPASIPLNQTTIRNAVLQKIPFGTTETIVHQKLEELGIGSDKLSHYYGPDNNQKAIIRIVFNPASVKLVKRHYGIHLLFDNEMKLDNVVVDIWLTGS